MSIKFNPDDFKDFDPNRFNGKKIEIKIMNIPEVMKAHYFIRPKREVVIPSVILAAPLILNKINRN